MHFYLERVRTAIDNAIANMTGEDLTRHPPGKWNSAEILEHLSLTYSGTVKLLKRCLEADRSSATAGTWKHRLANLVVVRWGYMPSGRQAPSHTAPRGKAPDVVVNLIRENLVAMDEVISRCELRFGTRAKIANHPHLGPLSAQDWRKFHWVRSRHHMKQIRRLNAKSESH